MPDGGSEGEQACGDTGVDPGEGAPAVGFEGELAFERVEDRFDPLAVTGEVAEAGGLVFAVGADQVGAEMAGDKVSKSRPAKPLSPRMTCPARIR
jgi:hypothetical protein